MRHILQVVWLFGEQLAGTVDPACFRYVLLLCELLDKFKWRTIGEYEKFAAIVYPFCTVSDPWVIHTSISIPLNILYVHHAECAEKVLATMQSPLVTARHASTVL